MFDNITCSCEEENNKLRKQIDKILDDFRISMLSKLNDNFSRFQEETQEKYNTILEIVEEIVKTIGDSNEDNPHLKTAMPKKKSKRTTKNEGPKP